MKNLYLVALSFCLVACGGAGSTPDTFQADPPAETVAVQPVVLTLPEVQPSEPVPAVIPAGFSSEGGSAIGVWYCASAGYEQGQYRSYWNNPWQLDFKSDMTVILQDGSNSISSWWYTENGLSIQWSHNGQVADYVLNVANREGMSDNGSHCLRQLPPVEPVTVVVEPVTEQSYTVFQCSLLGTLHVDNSNRIYNPAGDSMGEWASTPDYFDMSHVPNSTEPFGRGFYRFDYIGNDLQEPNTGEYCSHVSGPVRHWN